MVKKIILFFTASFLILSVHAKQQPDSSVYHSGSFVHPGMAQSRQDLDYMKQQVLKGEVLWKQAFENLKKTASLDFKPEPQAHVSVGAYGVNNKGGAALFKSANAAYNFSLMWYITGNKAYAEKAIEILNAWSYTLWDFDDNNAKLNVGLTGHYFLNAAEILKYSASGWAAKDVDQFKRMMLTVYYPTIKDFFTEANGNWDASMINTLLCIGVFTDNQQIFNKAVERFYRGPGNSGITKYIYPNGQIQETTRDWGHVQLGLGEFAKAAAVAWTQGLDFYAVAGNRLGLGFEYAAKFLLGGSVPVYGILSTAARDEFRDIYESVYFHYHFLKGFEMPYTGQLIKLHTRPESSVGFLTARRAPDRSLSRANFHFSLPAGIPSVTSLIGASVASTIPVPEGSVWVKPGESVQEALNSVAGTGKWVVLVKGVHPLNKPLMIPDGVTLSGQGKESVLFLSPSVSGYTMINGNASMHDVTIRDLLIEGASRVTTNADPNADRRIRSYMNAPNRGGILFSAERSGQMHHIRLENLTVQNCTKNGVSVKGAIDVQINHCNFSDNGGSVVPGAGFHHNLQLSHTEECRITNSRFDTSPWGNGIDLSFVQHTEITANELARNKLSGISCTESEDVNVEGNLAEGNDCNGISFFVLMNGSRKIKIERNLCMNNGGSGIFTDITSDAVVTDNTTEDNGIK